MIVSPEYLGAGERVLIIDDFLATGKTIEGLIRLAEIAGATVVGVGTLIEKTFEEGRAHLEEMNIHVEALARIESMSEEGIVFFRP